MDVQNNNMPENQDTNLNPAVDETNKSGFDFEFKIEREPETPEVVLEPKEQPTYEPVAPEQETGFDPMPPAEPTPEVEITPMPAMTTPPVEKKRGKGAIIGIVLIALALVLVAVYFLFFKDGTGELIYNKEIDKFFKTAKENTSNASNLNKVLIQSKNSITTVESLTLGFDDINFELAIDSIAKRALANVETIFKDGSQSFNLYSSNGKNYVNAPKVSNRYFEMSAEESLSINFEQLFNSFNNTDKNTKKLLDVFNVTIKNNIVKGNVKTTSEKVTINGQEYSTKRHRLRISEKTIQKFAIAFLQEVNKDTELKTIVEPLLTKDGKIQTVQESIDSLKKEVVKDEVLLTIDVYVEGLELRKMAILADEKPALVIENYNKTKDIHIYVGESGEEKITIKVVEIVANKYNISTEIDDNKITGTVELGELFALNMNISVQEKEIGTISIERTKLGQEKTFNINIYIPEKFNFTSENKIYYNKDVQTIETIETPEKMNVQEKKALEDIFGSFETLIPAVPMLTTNV